MIFHELKKYLQYFEAELVVVHDESDRYYSNTPAVETGGAAEFFGSVQIKKSYVAFHLMPIYYYPELLDQLSSDLKNKMQGKSCFNFRSVDDSLFAELNLLVKSCIGKYKEIGKI